LFFVFCFCFFTFFTFFLSFHNLKKKQTKEKENKEQQKQKTKEWPTKNIQEKIENITVVVVVGSCRVSGNGFFLFSQKKQCLKLRTV
jgi:glucan phosphoethanolaminetransferase (alkaline phosphatase superfamily)